MNTIILRDKEFPILFDMQNIKEIQKKYGSLENMVRKLNGSELEATAYVLWLMIREGVLLQNAELGLHDKPPDEDYISRMITLKDISDPQFTQAITDTFNEYMGGNATGQQLASVGTEMVMASMSSKSKKRTPKTSRKKAN